MTPKAPSKPVVTTPAPTKLTYKAPVAPAPAPEPPTMDQIREKIASHEGAIDKLKALLDVSVMAAYRAKK